jgi:hypothetical protein
MEPWVWFYSSSWRKKIHVLILVLIPEIRPKIGSDFNYGIRPNFGSDFSYKPPPPPKL